MKFLKKAALALTTSAVAVCAVAGLANASTTTSSAQCTYSNAEYLIYVDGASMSHSAGHATWSSSHKSGQNYEDAYDVTGYAQGSNSDSRCGHYGTDYSYRLPAPVSGDSVSSELSVSGSHFSGRTGWDVWLVPNSEAGKLTTSKTMEANRGTLEIMVQPGSSWIYQYSSSHWSRAYIGAGNINGHTVNLTHYVGVALSRMHINPSGYSWEAIDGGAEYTAGSMSLKSYNVNVHVSASATEGYGYNAYKAVSGQGITVGAWHYVYARKSATVSVTLQGRSYATAKADAASEAKSNATAGARSKAIIAADAAARSAAVKALTAKEPWGWTPRETGKSVVSADAAFQADGFKHRHVYSVRVPLGYHAVVSGQTYKWMAKTGTVYIWERAVR